MVKTQKWNHKRSLGLEYCSSGAAVASLRDAELASVYTFSFRLGRAAAIYQGGIHDPSEQRCGCKRRTSAQADDDVAMFTVVEFDGFAVAVAHACYNVSKLTKPGGEYCATDS